MLFKRVRLVPPKPHAAREGLSCDGADRGATIASLAFKRKTTFFAPDPVGLEAGALGKRI
jgi:hypothetical protein